MPHIIVKDTNIWYEAYGNGPTLLYLQSAWSGRNPGAYYVAGRLSKNYRVILWDSPNAGQLSDSVITDTKSEYHLCCDYIDGLCEQLNETSIHIAGCSGGGELALLFAHLYPERVKSVSMYRPTDTSSEAERAIVQARYSAVADIARNGTMQDVMHYSEKPPESRWKGASRWIYEITRKPTEKEKFLLLDASQFASILQKWGDWMLQKGFYRANLGDADLNSMQVPVLVVAAADPFHPEELAIELSEKLCVSKYIASPFFRPEQEMYGAPGEEHSFGGFPDFINHLEQFLETV
ncbi:MAG: alpha/beta hydrolase [Clostridiales bacterium]|nr:alpha/beta hydrolase [Clostridiales bacterium]